MSKDSEKLPIYQDYFFGLRKDGRTSIMGRNSKDEEWVEQMVIPSAEEVFGSPEKSVMNRMMDKIWKWLN